MWPAADQGVHTAGPSGAMRPRRWYGAELAPPRRHGVMLTARLWRYRTFVRRENDDATPKIGVASSHYHALRNCLKRGSLRGASPSTVAASYT